MFAEAFLEASAILVRPIAGSSRSERWSACGERQDPEGGCATARNGAGGPLLLDDQVQASFRCAGAYQHTGSGPVARPRTFPGGLSSSTGSPIRDTGRLLRQHSPQPFPDYSLKAPSPSRDSPTPAANAVAASVLLRLAVITKSRATPPSRAHSRRFCRRCRRLWAVRCRLPVGSGLHRRRGPCRIVVALRPPTTGGPRKDLLNRLGYLVRTRQSSAHAGERSRRTRLSRSLVAVSVHGGTACAPPARDGLRPCGGTLETFAGRGRPYRCSKPYVRSCPEEVQQLNHELAVTLPETLRRALQMGRSARERRLPCRARAQGLHPDASDPPALPAGQALADRSPPSPGGQGRFSARGRGPRHGALGRTRPTSWWSPMPWIRWRRRLQPRFPWRHRLGRGLLEHRVAKSPVIQLPNGPRQTQGVELATSISSSPTAKGRRSEEAGGVRDGPAGRIVAELFPKEAPGTVANFEKLANSGFYDGTRFHRVIDTSSPRAAIRCRRTRTARAYGTGGPGYTIQCETKCATPAQRQRAGSLSMAQRREGHRAAYPVLLRSTEQLNHTLDGGTHGLRQGGDRDGRSPQDQAGRRRDQVSGWRRVNIQLALVLRTTPSSTSTAAKLSVLGIFDRHLVEALIRRVHPPAPPRAAAQGPGHRGSGGPHR